MQMPRSSAHRPCTSLSSSPRFSEIWAVSCSSHRVKDSFNISFQTHTPLFNLEVEYDAPKKLSLKNRNTSLIHKKWDSSLLTNLWLDTDIYCTETGVLLASRSKDTKGTFSWLCRKCVTAIGQLLIHVHSSMRRPTLVCTLLPCRAEEITREMSTHAHAKCVMFYTYQNILSWDNEEPDVECERLCTIRHMIITSIRMETNIITNRNFNHGHRLSD